jgi:TrmH family RNA methyltransferase
MKTITSLQNTEIKTVTSLHNKKGRVTQQAFIAEGIRTIQPFLQAGYTLNGLYATDPLLAAAETLTHQDTITLVSDAVMAKISTAASPSGLLAVFAQPAQPASHLLTSGLVLANITDPGNMGTLLRTAAALNVKSVVVVEGTDPWSPKVVQATAGALAFVRVFTWTWHELLEHKGKLKLHALVVRGGTHPKNVEASHALLVVGNEAHGIDEQWQIVTRKSPFQCQAIQKV